MVLKMAHTKDAAGNSSVGMYSHHLLILSIAFFAINIVIFFLAVPSGALKFGADSGDYYVPAQALYEHGAYVWPKNIDHLRTYRTPGYPVFLATTMWLTNGSPIDLIIGLQTVMLFLTGLAAKSITKNWLPDYGDIAFGLIIFNPNALISSHLIQTDILMSLLFVTSIWSLDRYIKTRSFKVAMICGLSLGLACLVRPTPLYLILTLPIAFPLALALGGESIGWRRHLAAGVLASAIAGITLLPWMHYMAGEGEGYRLGSARVQFVFVMDNVLTLEQQRSGESQMVLSDKLRQREADYAKTLGDDWEKLSNVARYDVLTAFHFRNLTQFPPTILAKGAILGMGNMFTGGGATAYHQLLGLAHKSAAVISAEEYGSSYFAAFIKSLSYTSPAALIISTVAIGFAGTMRVMGLIGLIGLISRRHWPLLMVIFAVVSYFGLVHIFNSSARYRMPIETPLMILALYGFDRLKILRIRPSK